MLLELLLGLVELAAQVGVGELEILLRLFVGQGLVRFDLDRRVAPGAAVPRGLLFLEPRFLFRGLHNLLFDEVPAPRGADCGVALDAGGGIFDLCESRVG
jgi:hypothetical protein